MNTISVEELEKIDSSKITIRGCAAGGSVQQGIFSGGSEYSAG